MTDQSTPDHRPWTASTITDTALDTLYAALEELTADRAQLRAVAETRRCTLDKLIKAAATVEDELTDRAETAERERDRYRAAWRSARRDRARYRHDLRHLAVEAVRATLAAAREALRAERDALDAVRRVHQRDDAWCAADDEVWPCPTICAADTVEVAAIDRTTKETDR